MSDLWAITAYFNPVGYRRRRANYGLFRKHLAVPLVTVELGYGARFELGEGDADILLQIPGQDVMWQKERLLNLALEALPPGCTKVAWLDSDLIFQSDDWHRRNGDLLDDCALVQPFGRVLRTEAGWRPGDALVNVDAVHAVARQIESGVAVETCLTARGEASGTALGMGWAARRELLDRRGMYDANIIGDGDSVLLHAAFGCVDDAAARQKMNRRREEHFRAWAEPFHDEVRGRVGYVPGDVAHLWHGSRQDRRYDERITGLGAFDFDPAEDIAGDDTGAWRWNSSKPAMHAYVRDYFGARREDGAGIEARPQA